MIPRKELDIHWRDLALGLGACLWARSPDGAAFGDAESLTCLSVRSGFDLLLGTLALTRGSEVLTSAITIPPMLRILAEYGLVAVPVDLDMPTLSVTAEALRAAVTPQTKAILVAHLFGSRMDLEPILAVAREHGLFVIEDCAQTFVGPAFKGHPESDARMFSFGPIKTATALGGGVLFIRDAALRAKMKKRQSAYPCQSRFGYFRRLLLFSLFKLALAPWLYTGIIGLSRLFKRNHDEIVTSFGQSFKGRDFLLKIRHRPCAALLWMVHFRIRSYPVSRIEDRTRTGRQVLAGLPPGTMLGERAPGHTFWLFPIVTDGREDLMRRLWEAGFDAALGSTSLCTAEPPLDRPAMRACAAEAAMSRVLYLPVYAAVPPPDLQRLAGTIASRN
jgi:dTDP-4-amino-4,6-dideoxygalactose transaminase